MELTRVALATGLTIQAVDSMMKEYFKNPCNKQTDRPIFRTWQNHEYMLGVKGWNEKTRIEFTINDAGNLTHLQADVHVLAISTAKQLEDLFIAKLQPAQRQALENVLVGTEFEYTAQKQEQDTQTFQEFKRRHILPDKPLTSISAQQPAAYETYIPRAQVDAEALRNDTVNMAFSMLKRQMTGDEKKYINQIIDVIQSSNIQWDDKKIAELGGVFTLLAQQGDQLNTEELLKELEEFTAQLTSGVKTQIDQIKG